MHHKLLSRLLLSVSLLLSSSVLLNSTIAKAEVTQLDIDGNLGIVLKKYGRNSLRLFAGNPHLVPIKTIPFRLILDSKNRFAQIEGSADAFLYALNDFRLDAQPISNIPIKVTFSMTWFGDGLSFGRDPLTGGVLDVIGRPGTIFAGSLRFEGPLVAGGIQVVPLGDVFTGVQSVWSRWLVGGVGFNLISGQDVAAPDYVYKGDVMSAWIKSLSANSTVTINGIPYTFSGDFHGKVRPKPPICKASPDGSPIVAACGGVVTDITLDGSASKDLRGGPLSYLWSTDCPGAINPITSAVTTLSIPATDLVQSVSCMAFLTVQNQQGLSSNCYVPVEVGACPVECDEVPVEDPVTQLDVSSFDLAEIARRVSNRIIRSGALQRQARFARRAKREARALATASWNALETVPDFIPSCPDNPLCVQTEDVEVQVLTQSNAMEIRQLIEQLVVRLRRTTGRRRRGQRFLDRGDELLVSINTQLELIPDVVSSCN